MPRLNRSHAAVAAAPAGGWREAGGQRRRHPSRRRAPRIRRDSACFRGWVCDTSRSAATRWRSVVGCAAVRSMAACSSASWGRGERPIEERRDFGGFAEHVHLDLWQPSPKLCLKNRFALETAPPCSDATFSEELTLIFAVRPARAPSAQTSVSTRRSSSTTERRQRSSSSLSRTSVRRPLGTRVLPPRRRRLVQCSSWYLAGPLSRRERPAVDHHRPTEWLLPFAPWTFPAGELTDDVAVEALGDVVPRTRSHPPSPTSWRVGRCTALSSPMRRSRSPQQSTTSARRWRTSSCVDHFIFSVGSASPAGIARAQTSGVTYTVVTDPLDDDLASLCMRHASSRPSSASRRRRSSLGSASSPSCRASRWSSPVTRCRPIAETVVDRKDTRR